MRFLVDENFPGAAVSNHRPVDDYDHWKSLKEPVGRNKRSALRHLVRGFLQIDELRLGLEAAQ